MLFPFFIPDSHFCCRPFFFPTIFSTESSSLEKGKMHSEKQIFNKIVEKFLFLGMKHYYFFFSHDTFHSWKVVDEKKNGEIKWVQTKMDLDKHIVNHQWINKPSRITRKIRGKL